MSDQNIALKQESVKEMIVQVLHELRPNQGIDFWKKHVETNIHDPQKFFGNNGEGYNEYLAFLNTFDKDKYLKSLKRKQRQ